MRVLRVALVVALAAQPFAALKQMTIRHRVTPQLSHDRNDGVDIATKIKALSTEGKTVCVTLNEDLEAGGLSYTLGMVNAVMDFVYQHMDHVNLNFLMPEIRPPAFESADNFRFMFGEPAMRSETKWPKMYIATCPYNTDQCNVEETRVHQNTVFVQSRYEIDCEAYVMVSSQIVPVYDYSRTGSLLYEKYWHRESTLGKPSSSELQFPLTTAMHLSPDEGTAESLNTIASALTSLIDPKCLKVELHSDVEESSSDIQLVHASWMNMGVDDIEKFDTNTEVSATFESLTHADILIGGPNGFSRLAAVLGRAYVKLFVQNDGNMFPLEFMPSASLLPSQGFDLIAVTSALSTISNMTMLTARCNAWLGKSAEVL